MTDSDPRASQVSDQSAQRTNPGPGQPPLQTAAAEAAPFQTQLEYLSQTQQQSPVLPSPYGQHAFDMSAMAGALPPGIAQAMNQRPSYSSPDGQPHPSPTAFRLPQPMPFVPQRGGVQFPDPAMMARLQQQQPPPQHQQQQQQQVLPGQFVPAPSPIQNVPRQPGFQIPPPMPYGAIDPYGYAMSPTQFSPIDPRFAGQPPFATIPGMAPGRIPKNAAQASRRGSDTAPIPHFPRGPPRKPKQSGHALWVGNLPPAAQVTDLKDHFSRDATGDIESVFLIAKSNCAFVNYRTDQACVAAMNRFHDSRFNGVRLVCRLRRGTGPATGTTTTAEEGVETALEAAVETTSAASTTPTVTPEAKEGSPTIARSPLVQGARIVETLGTVSGSDAKTSDKYFIVKSLTAQDLEASVRNGTWATQSHNEDALNRAFEQADNVYLVFSANKSGEYFGYARMASAISGEPVNLSTIPGGGDDSLTDPAVIPQSIPTPATATAPKGRIIDDSARGTIFWEADRSDDEEGSPDKEPGGGAGGQNWGRQFQIEWISTNRLPFYRTRGLRNPWNGNREVKIARDGTELEPGIGQRLVSMFLRSPGSSSVPRNPTGMPV